MAKGRFSSAQPSMRHLERNEVESKDLRTEYLPSTKRMRRSFDSLPLAQDDTEMWEQWGLYRMYRRVVSVVWNRVS